MTSNGFVQLVQSPTTANGTLIDHVYCSNVPDNTIVEVHVFHTKRVKNRFCIFFFISQ